MDNNSSEQVTIHVVDPMGEKQSVSWQSGESLMEALRDNGVPILASCGGVCACATCHVYIDESLKDILGTRSECEDELLTGSSGFRPELSRLSCQIKFDELLKGMTVKLPPE